MTLISPLRSQRSYRLQSASLAVILTCFASLLFAPAHADVSQAQPTIFTIWSSAKQVDSECTQALKSAEEKLKLIKGAPQSVDELLTHYQALMLSLDTVMGLSSLSFNTHPDEETRNAAQRCEQKLSAFNSALGVDRDLYDRFIEVSADALKQLDGEAKRFYDLVVRDLKRAGVGLQASQRARIKEINERITALSQQFSKNVNSDTKKVSFTLAELKGLPQDLIKARRDGDASEVVFSTDYPDFFPFQRYVEDRSARAKLYRAFVQRGYPANVEVLKEVLALRHEYAQLLGAPHWAAYNAGDKMVGSAETIDKFLKRLVSITRPIADRELKVLLTRIQRDDPQAKRVESWDRFYYTNKLRAELHSFDPSSVRPYLSYQRVKAGVFELYGELFGLTFKRDERQPTWSPDVEAYTMHRDGALIGRFFLDMHPRPNKYKHAAMFPVQTGLSTGRLPVASLVCNFPKSSADQPGLMEHNQVTTLFHEFGHLIHHLLASRSPWVRLGGINTEWDFVEAPSQLLEEWAWSPRVLRRFALHHETGAPIKVELVEKLRAAEEFGKGVNVMRQIFYAAYSFYLHQRAPGQLDLPTFSREMYDQFSPYPAVEGGAIYANFGHLMGYSSMYYTYQWSLVIAKDLWSRFEREGLLSRELMREYAQKVLAAGGRYPAAKLARDFLGRDYRMDAYEAWLKR